MKTKQSHIEKKSNSNKDFTKPIYVRFADVNSKVPTIPDLT